MKDSIIFVTGNSKAVEKEKTSIFYGLVGIILFLLVFLMFLVRRYKKQLEKVEKMRETDLETGVGNAIHLRKKYTALISDRNRELHALFYFYVDIDRLESVSSKEERTLFLKHMAAVLQSHSSDADIMARVSDGGFALFHQMFKEEEMHEWLEPIIQKINAFTSDNSSLDASRVSVGIYMLRSDDRELDEMMLHAMQSAMLAYSSLKDYQICTNEVMQNFMVERKLQSSIRRGLDEKEFLLYIQFYVDSVTNRIVGGEALSRWNHAQMGLLTPERFVPLMEREGLVDELDYYSLERVCEFLEKLEEVGITDFFISCNFSRGTFSSEQFVDRCVSIIEKYRFDRELIIFEITESMMMKNVDVSNKNIQAIRELGISLALDDFGNGFSSFLDIQNYPLEGLKLDKCLVDNVGTRVGDVIVKAMIDIGHEIGITVLAEGVETEEQAARLRDMGCDVIQGFLFHYPIPEWEALRQLLESRKK